MRHQTAGIRWKMMKYFLVVVMIMGSCLIIFYQILMRNITGIAVESMENVLAKINLDTRNTLHEAQEMAYLVAKDKDIQLALIKDLPGTEKELYSQRIERNFQMADINRFTKNLDGIYIVGENGAFFRSINQSMYQKDFRQESWYRQVKESEEPLWTCQAEGSFMIKDMDAYMVSIIVPIIDRASYRFLGVTVVDVLMENLVQISQEGMVFDGMLLLLDEENQVLYSDHEGKLNAEEMELLKNALADKEFREQETTEIKVGAREFLISQVSLNIAGWKIAGMVSNETIYAQITFIRNLMLFTSGICVCISIWLAISASKGISEPILAIRSVMRKVEKGDLETHVEIKRSDEVGELAGSFNHMVNKLNLLVKEREENQKKLRIAELNALQAQINPHFLYNTLDSINWMARAGQIDQVSEMVDSLSVFFRISLSGGKTFITVEEELRHVENYILIQKKRYEKYLDYEIDVPEHIRGYQCLKMILQPLVENSIYHGIKEKGEKGLIRISASELSDSIIFCVTDTGQGMTKEKLQEIQAMLRKGEEHDAGSYGVMNVQRRIQTYFGKGYGLYFRSVWGEGTEVKVVIPRKQMLEGYDELESSTH